MQEVRLARPEDLADIRVLVASVDGDLDDLVADQFAVAQAASGDIVGCGRLKPYPGFCELASLAVKEGWRAAGGGRDVVSKLLEIHTSTIYLVCENNVVDFFRRFGFELIPVSEMLPGLRSKWEHYYTELGHMNVMRRE